MQWMSNFSCSFRGQQLAPDVCTTDDVVRTSEPVLIYTFIQCRISHFDTGHRLIDVELRAKTSTSEISNFELTDIQVANVVFYGFTETRWSTMK